MMAVLLVTLFVLGFAMWIVWMILGTANAVPRSRRHAASRAASAPERSPVADAIIDAGARYLAHRQAESAGGRPETGPRTHAPQLAGFDERGHGVTAIEGDAREAVDGTACDRPAYAEVPDASEGGILAALFGGCSDGGGHSYDDD